MVNVADSVWNDVLGILIVLVVFLLVYAGSKKQNIQDVVKGLWEKLR